MLYIEVLWDKRREKKKALTNSEMDLMLASISEQHLTLPTAIFSFVFGLEQR